jgi:hypothetical protein
MQLALAGAMAITFSDCGKEGHDKVNCWKLHPELRPSKKQKSRGNVKNGPRSLPMNWKRRRRVSGKVMRMGTLIRPQFWSILKKKKKRITCSKTYRSHRKQL